MNVKVWINGQEAQCVLDELTGVVTINYLNLKGELIPPLPDKPKEESYQISMQYETEFVDPYESGGGE